MMKRTKLKRVQNVRVIGESVNRFPGPYKQNPIFRRKLRYQAQAVETKDQDYVTMGSLQNLMFLGVGSTSALGFFSAIKLHSVELWADSSASNSLTTIGIDWLSPDSPNSQVNATGNSFAPAHFKSRPPKNSAASRWYAGQLLTQDGPSSLYTSTPYAFALVAPAGTICEIDFSFTLFDTTSLNNPFTCIGSGISAGILYFNAFLDNTSVSLGNATKNWAVQGIAASQPCYVSAW
jgi:hypothetical protein